MFWGCLLYPDLLFPGRRGMGTGDTILGGLTLKFTHPVFIPKPSRPTDTSSKVADALEVAQLCNRGLRCDSWAGHPIRGLASP